MYKNNAWWGQCVPELYEGDYVFLSYFWLVDYSCFEIDMKAMTIIKNEKNKSLQISNASQLLQKASNRLWEILCK